MCVSFVGWRKCTTNNGSSRRDEKERTVIDKTAVKLVLRKLLPAQKGVLMSGEVVLSNVLVTLNTD
jgi:hypothetical protein